MGNSVLSTSNKKSLRKCLEFWENEKLNIIYLERARKSLSFFVAKIKERRKMSDNIEIVMDIAVNKSPSPGDKKG